MTFLFALSLLAMPFQDVAFSARPTTAPPAELSVLAFNILTSGHPPGPDAACELYRVSRQERIAQIIIEVNPDVVLMQEAHSAQPIHDMLREHDPEWRMQGGGDRGQMILARHELQYRSPNSAKVSTPLGPVVVHNVHWEPYPYGPYEIQKRLIDGAPFTVEGILEVSDKGEVYAKTYLDVHPALSEGVPVVVGGDFNEPSHLDWSREYLDDGPDRWVGNPIGTPLKAIIPWKGSRLLTDPAAFSSELGQDEAASYPALVDTYRAIRPDVLRHPGNTWTPGYAPETVDRRPYRSSPAVDRGEVEPAAVLDRIDIIYASSDLVPVRVEVLGDSVSPSTDRPLDPWPSDHRAVLAVYTRDFGDVD